ncbi:1-(5-phosphoribosyl)-5-[(5-phosphoribosylamino)methylideneamino]imidazole-4-carboxamide isomerase [candidate division KSB1 bacterium]|nr:1-(5-phosphoribosyl)-5-[(5-phosphoribosylamino)methylideneamino]imidazole-4-carboxamide isomerase [candidate division KSB1 bacterium]
MLVLPAIDLLDGQAVRLKQGAEKTKKVYSDNPIEMGVKWHALGAEMIHVVNLDGAFGRAHKNVGILQQIVDLIDIPIELGGGIRTIEDVRRWLDIGVARVIIGTAALENPDVVKESILTFGADKIVIGIDGRDNKVVIRGWEEQTDISLLALALKMKEYGVKRIIYTDVHRDGEQCGPNLKNTDFIAKESDLLVIASGGFSSIDHFEQLRALNNPRIEGAIIGTALYEGTLDLGELNRRFSSV